MKQDEFNEMFCKALEDDDVLKKLKEKLKLSELKEWINNTFSKKSEATSAASDGYGSAKNSAYFQKQIADKDEDIRRLNAQLSQYRTLPQENNNLKSQVRTLQNQQQTELRNLETRIRQEEAQNRKQLETRIASLEKEHNKAKEDLQSAQDELQKAQSEAAQLRNRFKEAQELYERFQKLEPQMKRELQGIFKGNSLEQFIWCGVQSEKIPSLWEYMKDKALNGIDIRPLIPIFDYFFDAYNQTNDSPLWARTQTRVGERFDTDKHIRLQSGGVQGPLTRVILEGYTVAHNKKLLKKPVIEL
jgi:hypothetical protein